MSSRLIIFTRYPEPGATKTRLIPVLGPEGAIRLHRKMTEHTVACMRDLWQHGSFGVEIRYDGGNETLMREWLGDDLDYRAQGDGDLGERMARAFREAFEEGSSRVVIIGTDCPDLNAEMVAEAFNALHRDDVAVGPASDGGYYLIGLRRPVPELFRDIRWGTDEVYKETMKIVERLHLEAFVMTTLPDVDRPEDLSVWRRWSEESLDADLSCISVIVPTLNESAYVGTCLASATRGMNVELVVVDGGSDDETVEVARAHGALVVESRTGRASQMNAGAERATGEILLFLHADTQLPEAFDTHVRRTINQPDTVAGAFQFRVDASTRGLRVVERLANWRSRRLHMPYGDQAIFVNNEAFHQVGGFPDIPIMEDFELMRRLRRRGTIGTVPASVITSARRWQALGVLRTVLINQAMIVGYLLGVSPTRLARWYRRHTR